MMLVKSRAGTLSQPPNVTSAQQSCNTGCTFSLCTSAALEMILVCVNLPILDYQTKCHANPRRAPRLPRASGLGTPTMQIPIQHCKSKFLPHPSFSFMLDTSIHNCFFSFLYLSILSTLQIPEHISVRHDGHNVSDPTDLAFRFSIKSIS